MHCQQVESCSYSHTLVHALQRARRVQASISLNQGRLILSGKLLHPITGHDILFSLSYSVSSTCQTGVAPAGVLTRANAVTTNKRVYQKVGAEPLVMPSSSASLYDGILTGCMMVPLTSDLMGSTSMQDTILREVERYQQSHIQHGTAYGELDHPSYDSITFKELHIATVSHQVSNQGPQSTKPACYLFQYRNASCSQAEAASVPQ